MGIGEKERKEGNMWRRKKGEERGKKTKTKELWEWKKGVRGIREGEWKREGRRGGGERKRGKRGKVRKERGGWTFLENWTWGFLD